MTSPDDKPQGSSHTARLAAPVIATPRKRRTLEELIAEYGPPDRPEHAPPASNHR